MTQIQPQMTCDAAKRAIESRRFIGWRGLPAGCALACARDGALVMFDGMTPQLDGGWPALAADLGAPEATFDWIFGTVAMPAGELVYAKRGLTIFSNPENGAVAYITAYVPTTVDEYARLLRPPREKRPR